MTRPDLDQRLSTLLKAVGSEPPSELRFRPPNRSASTNVRASVIGRSATRSGQCRLRRRRRGGSVGAAEVRTALLDEGSDAFPTLGVGR